MTDEEDWSRGNQEEESENVVCMLAYWLSLLDRWINSFLCIFKFGQILKSWNDFIFLQLTEPLIRFFSYQYILIFISKALFAKNLLIHQHPNPVSFLMLTLQIYFRHIYHPCTSGSYLLMNKNFREIRLFFIDESLWDAIERVLISFHSYIT